ncbi:Putative R3H domain, Zinc finger C2H2-type, Zinc finger C2H2 superfamily, R3H domain superfamily [Septoria linicola]|uniref:R3H domain, Zinc finger C2H2-type, Zinc finger C2H2 superfamily, R3H domain superfamily n=1 Tax=Septoria linicola TaxID=215465 RepID=A0A9Q9ATC5_9PEZI|nr:Putative R3H domain, Zinc finger C2H2-type, Zinc finger C2H2 superfamily, R3H domain superfamily [Septoria linicola]
MDPYAQPAGDWNMDTSADTVNPADLSAIDLWDLSIYMDPFDQSLAPTAPVAIPGTQVAMPKHSRVSLLSTSPPDLGWQWGYDPMLIASPARRPSQGQLAKQSCGSITSRSRLLAATTDEAPETVYEDSDSHHSWTASDNFETWCNSLRERLADFRRCQERTVIITSALQTRQRRKVHSMANLLGLSHMSLGSGRNKQILMSKCELVRPASLTDAARDKRWNPVRDNWARGLVDPRAVLFEGLAMGETITRFQQHLLDAGLPLPKRLAIDPNCVLGDGRMKTSTTMYACFETPDDAAVTVLALDQAKPNWNANESNLECDYVRFPPGSDLEDTLCAHFETLPRLLREQSSRQQVQANASFVSQSTDCAMYSDSENEDFSLASPGLTMPMHRFSSRTLSNGSSQSRDAGYASGCSVISQMLSEHSEASATKKRKRMPKGSYPCTFGACDKVFHRDGDRRKHEKNHSGERKHTCEKCSRGFLFPKDLKRHMVTHGCAVSGG